MQKSRTFVTLSLFILLSVPVWAAGGAYKGWQTPFIWVSLLAWACHLLPAKGKGLTPRAERLNRLRKDPACWASLGFLFLLIVQTLNSGRMRVFNFDLGQWEYSPPPVPFLPWAVTRAESYEMIQWFVPILTFFLLLRHTEKHINKPLLIWMVLLNSMLNAALAFTHLALDWEYMYDFKELGKDVYGSFGYPNHGAMYFILMFSLSFGCMLKELFAEQSVRSQTRLVLAVIISPILFLAANLSTSRMGILGAWLVLLVGLLLIVLLGWPRVHPAQRVMGGALFGGLILFGILGFTWFADSVHFTELHNATYGLNIANEIDIRFFQVEAAFEIWKDYPIVGVGGWGYRYFVAQYLPMDQWHILNAGKANVHNDLMQFLAEFGIIGVICLSVIFLPTVFRRVREVFVSPFKSTSFWADPMHIPLGCGLGILFLVSQFDIPLRSPAVFMHGILLLYLLKPNPKTFSVWQPLVHWKYLRPLQTYGKSSFREI